MLELRNISKTYVTSSFTQTALDDVSLTFRDNEFVAILGPSGSGKTTMLNVIGGLDHFDSGDLVIDGISTRKYRDRDWDTYRNNRIGFVFQSYNLIPHQSVLSNVELALTLSGVSKAERRARAKEALERVGLGQHMDKRPSQLSGGQMQRVAIARALINDPEILLADEPTGALDSKTSVQVMDLLKEVANDRLVIMVTHNPDLAHAYATRIVELSDGRVTSDSDPVDMDSVELREAKQPRRTRMSFLTALALSFNNLMTKKGRTLMTAFAGSIGIIGIAAILALANGVNDYIRGVEEDTLSIYPLSIQSTGFDMTAVIAENVGGAEDEEEVPETVERDVGEIKMVSRMFSGVGRNDLAALKVYLDANGGGVLEHVNEIAYTYDAVPQIFLPDTSNGVHQVNPETAFNSFGFNSMQSSVFSSAYSMTMFRQFPSSVELFEEQYDIRAGRWPEAWDELVLVLSYSGNISDMLEYTLGLRDHAELEEMARALANGEEIAGSEGELSFSYEELMACEFRLVPASALYEYEGEYGVWASRADDAAFMARLVENGEPLRIVGIVQPKEDVDATSLVTGIYYTPDLVFHVMDVAASSEIVLAQQADPDVNVFTGKRFDDPEAQSDFDMGTLITVDGDVISSAFRIDTSALSFDPSALDFSGIDLSGVSVPPMDLSGLTFDVSDIQALTPEQLQALFPELTPEDLAEILENVDIRFVPGGEEALQIALSQIGQGYAIWRIENPDGTLEDYMNSEGVREQIVAAVAASLDTDAMVQSLVEALAEKMDMEPEIEGLTQEVVSRLIGAYTQQIASALAAQLTAAISNYMQQALASYMGQLSNAIQGQLSNAMSSIAANMQNAFSIDTDAFASAFQFNMDETQLAELMASLMSTEQATYEGNLRRLGYADRTKPSQIDIYPIDFDHKQAVVDILDAYNDRMRVEDEDKVVNYTDIVGALMSSVTRIIDMISTMLIAFVSISLIVSSIMIGVITYISVLERKKEIGILRSIGASKRDVSNVFTAETVIEGLVAGIMGVLITLAISVPANAIVHDAFGVERIAQLPLEAGLILVGISVFLNVIAGIIPARAASNSDPVEALRSE